MPFLRSRDYLPYIQPNILAQLLQSSATQFGGTPLEVRISAEDDAIEEISQYLRQKYDVEHAFADLLTYNYTDTYNANDRVELTAPAYVAQSQSTVNQIVLYTDNKIYLCIQLTAPLWIAQDYTVGQKVLYTDGNYYNCILNTVAHAIPTNPTYWALIASQAPGNTAYWTALGWNVQLFYLQYPYPLFDITKTNYKIGDDVFWKGSIYKCLRPSSWLSDEASIQYDYTTEFPQPNYFPGCINDQNSVAQWGVGTPYSVTGVSMVTTAPIWISASNWVVQNYTAGQYVIYPVDGLLYKCILDTVGDAPPSNPTYWTVEGDIYAQGQLATYNNVLYIALKNNTNIIPGSDIVTWVPIIWKAGDNRNRILVQNTIHCTLFNLHNNVAPQNIPIQREKNHIRALKWCEDIKEAILVVDLLTMPVLQPPKGGRILIGGRPKLDNDW